MATGDYAHLYAHCDDASPLGSPLAYAQSGPPLEYTWIVCLFCNEKTFAPEFMRREFELIGCGCPQGYAQGSDERLAAQDAMDNDAGWIPPRENQTLMTTLTLLTASLSAAPWSLICMIVSLVLLALAALSWPRDTGRLSLGWAGVFFFVLSVALG